MKDAGAKQGERCTFCQTTMNEGAQVCVSCGATRSVKRSGPFPVVGQIIFFLAFLWTFVGILFGIKSWIDWVTVLVPYAVAIAIGYLGPLRVTYSR